MKIAVSRFYNPYLKTAEAQAEWVAVRIAIGAPRFPPGYPIPVSYQPLMPTKAMLEARRADLTTWEQFGAQMLDRLDRAGAVTIWHELAAISRAHVGRGVVLLCYEDVRKPGEHCHRQIVAGWLTAQLGIAVDELPDPSTPTEAKPRAPKRARSDAGAQLAFLGGEIPSGIVRPRPGLGVDTTPGDPFAGASDVERLPTSSRPPPPLVTTAAIFRAVGKAMRQIDHVEARHGDTFVVRSATSSDRYTVAIDAEGHAVCDCPAGRKQSACWHAAAALQRHGEGWTG